MFTVYQIRLTDEQINQINAEGHDAVEAQRIRLKLQFDGSDEFEEAMFEHFTPVYRVESNDLDEVFHLTNMWNDESRVTRLNGPAASTSVGDIIVDEDLGQVWMVNSFGFGRIDMFIE